MQGSSSRRRMDIRLAGQVLSLLLTAVSCAAAPTVTTPLQFTLHRMSVNWESGYRHCLELGEELAVVQPSFIGEFKQHWSLLRISPLIWFGVFLDLEINKMFSPQCQEQESYNSLVTHESSSDTCGAISYNSDSSPKVKFRPCWEANYFVCMKEVDSCTFDIKNDTDIMSVPFGRSNLNPDSCRDECLGYYLGGDECLAYSYKGKTCWLYTGNMTEDLTTVDTPGNVVHIKSCYFFSENVDTVKDIEPRVPACVTEQSTAILLQSSSSNFKSSDDVTTSWMISLTSSVSSLPRSFPVPPFSPSTADSMSKLLAYSLTPSQGEAIYILSLTATTSSRTTAATSSGQTAATSSKPTSARPSLTSFTTTGSALVTPTDANTVDSSPSSVIPSSHQDESRRHVTKECLCTCTHNATLPAVTTEELVRKLQVPKKQLSSYVRSKTSAPDDRPSAQAIGNLGIVLLVSTGVLVLILDFNVLIQSLNDLLRPRLVP